MKSANQYFHEAGLLLMQGQLEEASNRLREGLHLDSNNKVAWMNWGVVLKDCGEEEEAEQCLRQAISLDHNYGDAWFNLGSLYLRELENYEEALNCLREAMRCNPNDEDAVSFSAEALVELKRYGEASALLDKAIKEHPNWTKVLQTKNSFTALFRKYMEDIAESNFTSLGKFVPQEAEPIMVLRTADSQLPFQFNYGASYVISINNFIPKSDIIKAFIVQQLGVKNVLDKVVFEAFGARPPESFKVEIGRKVPLDISQVVVQACFDNSGAPVEFSVEQEDKSFGYTQRVYIGSIGRTKGVLMTKEKLNTLLESGLTQQEFFNILLMN